LVYFDAFAGTGDREEDPKIFPLFNDDQEWLKGEGIFKGSARISLETEPSFDRFIFVEKSKRKFDQLKKLATAFPEKSNSIQFVRDDANSAIEEFCRTTNWLRTRAVMFLDPYGMQVDWKTIQLIATTKSIDLWYLVPAMIGIARLLKNDGNIPEPWEDRLDRNLGTTNWRDAFFVEETEKNLFGEMSSHVSKTADVRSIEKFIFERLSSEFEAVAEHGLPLRNSRNQCMYLLMFACGNKRGAKVALPIARHILGY
jgi:three-Cys-motif partner protein